MDTIFEGYIIKTIRYREHGKLIYIYSNKGITSALARNALKMTSPLSAVAQTGTLASFTLTQGSLPTLKEAQIVAHYANIKGHLEKQTILSVVHELIYHNLTKEDDHPKLFAFIKKFLHALNATDAFLELALVFELKFLYFLGFGVNFLQCEICQSKDALLFYPNSGSVLCQHHSVTQQTSLNASEFYPLKYYLHLTIESFQPLNLTHDDVLKYHRIVDNLYRHYLSFETKSKKVLYTLL